MQYTQLGERGPRVSRIAFGNWSAGGDWGRVDRAAAIAATRETLDLGITFFVFDGAQRSAAQWAR